MDELEKKTIKENILEGLNKILNFIYKYEFYSQIFIFVVLGFLLFFSPRRWIEYGMLPGILEIFFFYIVILLFASLFSSVIITGYKRKNKLPFDYADTATMGVKRLSFLLGNIAFVFVFLYLIGVEIKSFLTTISIFSVAFVLIFKEYIANIINGMILMFSRNLKLKEYIKVGEYKGRVNDITFLNVEMRTDDGDVVYIPNSILLSKELTNFSKSTIKRIRYEFKTPLSYAGKIEELLTFISFGLCREFEVYINPENVVLKVQSLSNEDISLLLEITTTKYNFKIEEQIKRVASLLILKFVSNTLDNEGKTFGNKKLNTFI